MFCLPLLQGTRDYSSVDARICKGHVPSERLSEARFSNFCGLTPHGSRLKPAAATATIKKVQDTESQETYLLPLEQQLFKRVRRSIQRKWSEIQANNSYKNKKCVQSELGERDGNQEMLRSVQKYVFV